MEWSEWILTDNDCWQYMRQNGTKYEMIQAVWLDRTKEDKEQRGLSEYCVVQGVIDLADYSPEEIEIYISSYGYKYEDREKLGDYMIAECILEDILLSDAYVVADVDTIEEAERYIKKTISIEN